jgi:hypothetical protein
MRVDFRSINIPPIRTIRTRIGASLDMTGTYVKSKSAAPVFGFRDFVLLPYLLRRFFV